MLRETTIRDLALFAQLEYSSRDRELMADLVDATLVWADSDVIVPLSTAVVEALWEDELADDIVRALEGAAERSERIAAALDDARADLARGPRRSRLARAYVEQAAVQLAGEEQAPVCCLLCIEEGIAAAEAPARAALARSVARIASRAAAVPEVEVRTALRRAAAGGEPVALQLGTRERRRAVRAWLDRLAALGATSLPALAAALRRELSGPMPPVGTDALWQETAAALVERLGPAWN